MIIIDLELELAIINETIEESNEEFSKLRKDYQTLQKHTDTLELEVVFKEYKIDFSRFWRVKRNFLLTFIMAQSPLRNLIDWQLNEVLGE